MLCGRARAVIRGRAIGIVFLSLPARFPPPRTPLMKEDCDDRHWTCTPKATSLEQLPSHAGQTHFCRGAHHAGERGECDGASAPLFFLKFYSSVKSRAR